MSRVRAEGGFTMPEILVGMMLMLLVMAASLSVLDQFRSIHGRTDRRVDLNDEARNTSRILARSLRNLAASPDLPTVVERSGDYDLVFRAVDKPRASGLNTRNLKRVRYCLDAANPSRGRVIEQTQRWTSESAPSMPTGTTCPSTSWGSHRVIGDNVTNRANSANRPLWAYGRTAAGQVSSVKLNLFVNGDPKTKSREVSQTTAVFLRNQNRSPVAVFTAAMTGVRHILLNGSGSYDPEGEPIEFRWFVNNVDVGGGLSLSWLAPKAGTYAVSLEVRDPAGLVDRTPATSVVVK